MFPPTSTNPDEKLDIRRNAHKEHSMKTEGEEIFLD